MTEVDENKNVINVNGLPDAGGFVNVAPEEAEMPEEGNDGAEPEPAVEAMAVGFATTVEDAAPAEKPAAEEPVKPKRKRRTRAEIEAAVAEAKAKASEATKDVDTPTITISEHQPELAGAHITNQTRTEQDAGRRALARRAVAAE